MHKYTSRMANDPKYYAFPRTDPTPWIPFDDEVRQHKVKWLRIIGVIVAVFVVTYAQALAR